MPRKHRLRRRRGQRSRLKASGFSAAQRRAERNWQALKDSVEAPAEAWTYMQIVGALWIARTAVGPSQAA